MNIFYFKKTNEKGEIEYVMSYNNTRPNITDPLVLETTKDEYETFLVELLTQESEKSETDEISTEEALSIIVETGIN